MTTLLPFVLFGVALLIARGFEFVNGFHAPPTLSRLPVGQSRGRVVRFLQTSTGVVAFSIVSLLPVELILQVELTSAAVCWRPFDQADSPPIVGRFRYVRQSLVRRGAGFLVCAGAVAWVLPHPLSFDVSRAGEPRPASELRIAVYDAPPYGAVGADGSLSGVSVDQWRRVAEELQRQYRLIPVSTMDTVLGGLEQDRFDAAIGAITITSERARVDFSYPAHRSGVAVALAKESGLTAFLASFSAAAEEFAGVIVLVLALLFPLGFLIWRIERPASDARQATGGTVTSFLDGLYWAAVTMTTVGYGDKDSSRALRRGCLDVVQRGADDVFIGQCGLALDCGSS